MKYWKFKLVSLLLIVIALFTFIKVKTTWLDSENSIENNKKHEAYYIEKLAKQLDAESEFRVEGGRIDLLTDTHAIEVEWAPKWKEAIGQALWYAHQTNTKAKIILLLKKESEGNYFIMLNSVILDRKIEIDTQCIELFKMADEDSELILK